MAGRGGIVNYFSNIRPCTAACNKIVSFYNKILMHAAVVEDKKKRTETEDGDRVAISQRNVFSFRCDFGFTFLLFLLVLYYIISICIPIPMLWTTPDLPAMLIQAQIHRFLSNFYYMNIFVRTIFIYSLLIAAGIAAVQHNPTFTFTNCNKFRLSRLRVFHKFISL